MTVIVPRVAIATLRRIVLAFVLATATMLCVSAVGYLAVASAEWNQGEFDDCTTRTDTAWLEGDISTAEHVYFYELCCGRSGGSWTPHGNQGLGVCGPTPAIAASSPTAPPSEAANPDVPAGPPTPTKPGPKPLTPKTSLTLAPIVPVG